MVTATTIPLLAVDLGSSNGRAILGRFDGERLALTELHRFENAPLPLPSGLHWDAPGLFRALLTGLSAAVAETGGRLAGLAVDTWGVDFGLLDRTGALLGLPYCYRDPRAVPTVEQVAAIIPPPELYARTGCQTLPINTLYQLMAARESPAFAMAERMLLMPDLFTCWLTGLTGAEATIASTTQLYDPRARDWADDVVERLALPRSLFPPIVRPGTVRGPLLPAVASETGAPASLPVISVAGHDTASAYAATPDASTSFVISLGTWSLAGVELAEPLLSAAAQKANFTNEAGAEGTTRFLRITGGLWLLQECRRTWASEGTSLDYAAMMELAAAVAPFGPLIDPDDPSLVEPGDMPARIRAACRRNGQPLPETHGAVVRCVLESLALRFRALAGLTERLIGRPLPVVRIVGGGARNTLLCQLTADATGRPVLAGPVEATALGNLGLQLMALGELASLADLRAVVSRSAPSVRYDPTPDRAAWDEAAARFERLWGR